MITWHSKPSSIGITCFETQRYNFSNSTLYGRVDDYVDWYAAGWIKREYLGPLAFNQDKTMFFKTLREATAYTEEVLANKLNDLKISNV